MKKMIQRANWFRVEFYDKATGKERYRTFRIPVTKSGNLMDTLRQKIRACGFRSFDILGYEITGSNYLR